MPGPGILESSFVQKLDDFFLDRGVVKAYKELVFRPSFCAFIFAACHINKTRA
jgi:hypothetical protein